VSKCSSPYPQLVVGGSGSGVVSQAGAALLLRTAESVGLITETPRRARSGQDRVGFGGRGRAGR
jgi:hypothetical protein